MKIKEAPATPKVSPTMEETKEVEGILKEENIPTAKNDLRNSGTVSIGDDNTIEYGEKKGLCPILRLTCEDLKDWLELNKA